MDDPTRRLEPPEPRVVGTRSRVDGARLWIGGVLAGVVAAGVAIVGLLIVRGILDIRVFVPRGEGGLVTPSSIWYAAAAFVAALVATALLHLLIASTAPAPFSFFSWIVGLATAIAVLVPFTTGAALEARVATAAINLAIGLAVLSIVSSVGRSALRRAVTPAETTSFSRAA